MATMPTLRPMLRYSRAKAPRRVLLPEPVGPVTPTMCARPVCGRSERRASRASGYPFSTQVRMRVRARRSPSRTRWAMSEVTPSEPQRERTNGTNGWNRGSRAGCGAALGRVVAHPIDDVVRGRAGAEDTLEAQLLKLGDVIVRDDAAAEEDDVVHAALLQLLHYAREELQVSTGEDGEPYDVGVLLKRGLGDHFGGLADACVDDLEAGVAEGPGDYFGAAVVSVEAGLGDDDLDFAFLGHSCSIIAGGWEESLIGQYGRRDLVKRHRLKSKA